MALDATDLTPPEEEEEAPATDVTYSYAPTPPVNTASTAAPASLILTSDMVRNSPEFRELQKQNRTLARQAGTAEATAAAARADAEKVRQAAEAQQEEAVARQIEETLGPEGIAAWNQISELSQTDPLAAARALAEFRISAQSAAASGQSDISLPITQEGRPTVPAQGSGAQPAPPMSSSLHADSPLGSVTPQDSDQATVEALDRRYTEIATRAQDPVMRNRVTDRERQEGFMAHFASGVVRQLTARRQGTR